MPKNKMVQRMHDIYKSGYIDGASDMEQTTMDYVLIALGRLGWGETRLARLKEKLDEVWQDYGTLFREDKADKDDEFVYAIEKVDQELKRYCGEKFIPYDERHKNGRHMILCKTRSEQKQ